MEQVMKNRILDQTAELIALYGWSNMLYAFAAIARSTNQQILAHDLDLKGNIEREIETGARAGMGTNYKPKPCPDQCPTCATARKNFA